MPPIKSVFVAFLLASGLLAQRAHSQEAAEIPPPLEPAPLEPEPLVPEPVSPIVQSAPVQPAPMLSAPSAGPVLVLPVTLPFDFSSEEIVELQRLGCFFTAEDLAVMTRMRLRGFDKAQVVAAYGDAARFGATRRVGAERVERIGTLRYLGVPLEGRAPYVSTTAYYNKYVVGGKGAWIAGWILGPIGLLTSAIGVIVVATAGNAGNACASDADDDEYCNPEEEREDAKFAGTTLLFMGAANMLTGIPLLVVGGAKRSRRAPRGLLDDGTLEEMAPYRLSGDRISAAPSPELRVGTAGGRQGLSLNATLSF